MKGWISQWLAFSEYQPAVARLIELSFHVAVIVAIGGAIAMMAKRRSAATAHMTWATALAAILMLLPAGIWVPRYSVALASVPSARVESSVAESSPPVTPLRSLDNRIAFDPAADRRGRVLPSDRAVRGPYADKDPAADRDSSRAPSEVGGEMAGRTQAVVERAAVVGPIRGTASDAPHHANGFEATPSSPPTGVFWWGLLCVYIAGLLAGLVHIVVGWYRLWRDCCFGQPLSPQEAEHVADCAATIGLRRHPRCVLSNSVRVPLVWGVIRPRIVLPLDFETLPVRIRRDCLLHEMSHIARGDLFWHELSCLAKAIYWFHPAVHYAARSLKHWREDAADDHVLRCGIDSSEYASTLLEVATSVGRRRFAPAIAMASGLPIENRLRRILDQRTGRMPPSRSFRIVLAVAFLTVSLVGVRFHRAAAAPTATADENETPANRGDGSATVPPPSPLLAGGPGRSQDAEFVTESSAPTFFELLSNAELCRGDTGGMVLNVRGTVRDQGGQAVAGAVVVLREDSVYRISSIGRQERVGSQKEVTVDDLFARTQSAADGTFVFENVRVAKPVDGYKERWNWDVIAAIEGDALGWANLHIQTVQRADGSEIIADVKLRAVSAVTGQVLSVDGDPIAGALLSISQFDDPVPSNMYNPYRNNELRLYASRLQPKVRSDSEGRFRFPAVPDGLCASIYPKHRDHEMVGYRVVSPATELPNRNAQPEESAGRPNREPKAIVSPVTINAIPQIRLMGTLRSESGDPIEGGVIRMGGLVAHVESDADGHFVWPTNEGVIRVSGYVRAQGEPPTVTFTASKPDSHFVWLIDEVSVEDLLASHKVDLVMQEGIAVDGKVLCRQTNTPVAGVNVQVSPSGDVSRLMPLSTKTDENGAYRFIAPKQPVTISLDGPVAGYDVPSARGVYGADREKVVSRQLDLSPGSAVTMEPFLVDRVDPMVVRVIGPHGEPIENAGIKAVRLVGAATDQMPKRAWSVHEKPLALDGKTDANGQCELQVNARDWADGYLEARATIDGVSWFGLIWITYKGQTPLIVKLREPWVITGRVLVEGNPAANVPVNLMRTMGKRVQLMGAFTSTTHDVTATDANGEYRFVTRANEGYRVSVMSPPAGYDRGSGSQSRLTRMNENEFRATDIAFGKAADQPATPTGSISGVVRGSDGVPIAGASVSPTQYMGDSRNVPRPRGKQVQTADDGSFRIEGLDLGRLRVHIYGPRPKTDDKSTPTLVATFVVVDVGTENIEVVLDTDLRRALPRIPAQRVVPSSSIPKQDP
ncbi:M56 family metallopeptidase [Novipirellula artificiosorum]|uniref:Regulatory protein BlaR1 n=1 Tax=Novipirellula artificiosorum TaxID=2528016 RepID=A0A5C6DWH2_9BACT|nr:M56 family metallopeptidase [Novipirellula artificiosorum]TWU41080.1 Regulatory protein BlaR1 [Novipirellula artificiosorum]